MVSYGKFHLRFENRGLWEHVPKLMLVFQGVLGGLLAICFLLLLLFEKVLAKFPLELLSRSISRDFLLLNRFFRKVSGDRCSHGHFAGRKSVTKPCRAVTEKSVPTPPFSPCFIWRRSVCVHDVQTYKGDNHEYSR